MHRTRIKICGLTRADDVAAAAAAGADAAGFICYEGSPRYVPVERLAVLVAALPPFVAPVLLFVDASVAAIGAALAVVPHAIVQLHGRADPAFCAALGRPYLRALPIDATTDLLDSETMFAHAQALIADTPSPGHGGSGIAFDWRRLPAAAARRKPLILAGGLNAGNVAAAIFAVRPFAVDVSSGVEVDGVKGVKSVDKMRAFVAAVCAADAAADAADAAPA